MIVYKLVRKEGGKRWSLNTNIVVEYIPGKVTSHLYPLFAFDSIENASPGDGILVELWAAEATEVRFINLVLFPDLLSDKKVLEWFWAQMTSSGIATKLVVSPRRGTVICDSITLKERIS